MWLIFTKGLSALTKKLIEPRKIFVMLFSIRNIFLSSMSFFVNALNPLVNINHIDKTSYSIFLSCGYGLTDIPFDSYDQIDR